MKLQHNQQGKLEIEIEGRLITYDPLYHNFWVNLETNYYKVEGTRRGNIEDIAQRLRGLTSSVTFKTQHLNQAHEIECLIIPIGVKSYDTGIYIPSQEELKKQVDIMKLAIHFYCTIRGIPFTKKEYDALPETDKQEAIIL